METGCPKCGFTLKEFYNFCPSCGEKLKDICLECGKELAFEGASFCYYCGAQIAKEEVVGNALEEEEKVRKEEAKKVKSSFLESVIHPVEKRALQKAEELLKEFSRLYDVSLLLPPEKLGLNIEGSNFYLEKIDLEREVFSFFEDFILRDLPLFFLSRGIKDKWEICEERIIISQTLWIKTTAEIRRWLLGYLIGNWYRKHYYYKKLREEAEAQEEKYKNWEKWEDFVFALRYLEQIGSFTCDRFGVLSIGDLNVSIEALYLLKTGERASAGTASKELEKFPFWQKRIEELKSFLISEDFSNLKKYIEKNRKKTLIIDKELLFPSLGEEIDRDKSSKENITPEVDILKPADISRGISSVLEKVTTESQEEKVILPDLSFDAKSFQQEESTLDLLPEEMELTDRNEGTNKESIDTKEVITEIEEANDKEQKPAVDKSEEIKLKSKEEKPLISEVAKKEEKTDLSTQKFYILEYGNNRISIWQNKEWIGSLAVDQIKYICWGKWEGEKGFWAIDLRNHQIIFYSLTGEVLNRFGEKGHKPGQYNFPLSVIQNGESLYICDSWNNRIVEVDLHGNMLNIFTESENTKLSYPAAALKKGDKIYFLDAGNKRVLRLKNGKTLKKVFSFSESVDSPVAMFKHREYFYIVDNENHTVFVFNAMGKLERKIGEYGSGPGQLDTPEGICIYDDYVLVANSWNHRIEVFTTEGEFLYHFGRHGIEPGYMNTPTSILVEEDEDV